MACCTLLHPFTNKDQYSASASPLLKPKPKPKPQPQPTTADVYPQSINAFHFPVIGRLGFPEGEEPLSLNELCDSLQTNLNPTSTWRLVPLPDGYYSLQFTCLADQLQVSSMPAFSLSRGTLSILPEFDAYRNIHPTPRDKSITFVRWRLPSPSWIKVNTDGSARGCPGPSSCGGVFRDSRGVVLGCFSRKLGSGIALEAELSACVYALEVANERGWKKIWLESDCTEVVELLSLRSTAVPASLKKSWMRVLGFLEHMELRASHIYREGNRVADALAGPDMEEGWWTYPTPPISELVYEDSIGCVNTRLRL